MTHDFRQVDVFSDGPFTGNPVAVIASAADLTDEQMRAISRWTNLSECTFLLPPRASQADYRVRIFALETELPFAGHPTLGTARAWLDLGGVPQRPGLVVQECGVGLVKVRVQADQLAFQAPPLMRSGPVSAQDRAALLRVLGLDEAHVVDAAWVDNGPGWAAVLVDSAETVLSVVPQPQALDADHPQAIGVAGLYPHDVHDAPALEVRGFFPDGTGGLLEDPVTGSLNASLAQWLISSGRLRPPYVARQGTVIGRRGRVLIEAGEDPAEASGTEPSAESLWVGGRAEVRIRGSLTARAVDA
ncbi:PhzF family phenazine biosynthesis protein [Nesterenkonia rhizosphaerae]|uniref:PhzF family phenazine biosynthesis protein n=1 Tax=Nesterenkonia rhizosphaerae TaxID=1348272 RepID=A0ABP9G0H2_9MICC